MELHSWCYCGSTGFELYLNCLRECASRGPVKVVGSTSLVGEIGGPFRWHCGLPAVAVAGSGSIYIIFILDLF